MAITKSEVAKLYIVMFGRAVEKSGLEAWVKFGADKTLAQVADFMLETQAAKDLYKSVENNEEFINIVYKNLFNKDSSTDAEGVKAWADMLNKGTIASRGEAVRLIMQTAETEEAKKADPDAAAVFANKVTISEFVADKWSNVEKNTDGSFDYKKFQDAIKGITPENLETKKAELEKIGKNIKLTTEIDSIEGTHRDDTFDAVLYLGQSTKKSTLSSLDVINGKEGNDTLNLLIKDDGFVSPLSAPISNHLGSGISNIENLVITSASENPDIGLISGFKKIEVRDTGDVVLNTDAKDVKVLTTGFVKYGDDEGTEKVTIITTNADIAVPNPGVPGLPQKPTSNNIFTNATEVTIKAAGETTLTARKATKVDVDLTSHTAITSPEFTLNGKFEKAIDIKLSGLRALTKIEADEAKSITLNKVELHNDGIVANKLEKATAISQGQHGKTKFTTEVVEAFDLSLGGKTSQAKIKAEKLKSLTVHANAEDGNKVEVDNASVALERVVVDGNGKLLALDVSDQAFVALKTIDASAFTGKLSIKVNAKADKSVQLGSGDDILSVTEQITAKNKFDGGDGVDMLSLTSQIATGGGINLAGVKNFEGLIIEDALGAKLDLANFGEMNKNIIFKNVNQAQEVDNLANEGTLTFEQAQNATTTVKIKGDVAGQADILNIVAKDNVNVKAENIETINLNVAKKEGLTATLDSAKATTLNITGEGNVTQLTTTNQDELKTIDASALNGGIKYTVADDKKLELLKGGKGSDEIKFSAKFEDLVIEGGKGADIFEVTKNELNDLNNVSADSFTTIKDFGTDDKLRIANADVTKDNKLVMYKYDQNLDFNKNLEKAIEATGGNNNSKTVVFQYKDLNNDKTNTYVIVDDDGAIDQNNTVIVKLAGVVDLTEANFTN